jgi:hypothetical protein
MGETGRGGPLHAISMQKLEKYHSLKYLNSWNLYHRIYSDKAEIIHKEKHRKLKDLVFMRTKKQLISQPSKT